MNWRIRLPGALYRLARDKAGGDRELQAATVIWLELYVTGDTVAAAHGAKGGRARAAALSPEERRASAQHAAAVRWTDHRSGDDG